MSGGNALTREAGYGARLSELVRGSQWLMEILRAARVLDLPDWAVAAGVVRTLVWDHLHGFDSPSVMNDVDVLFFSATRVDEKAAEQQLTELAPTFEWEAKNQAFIHEWYDRKLGVSVSPYRSTTEGIAGFVETATAVGLRLETDDSLTVIAPHGLADLFELKLRCNVGAPEPEYFQKRVTAKRWLERWPRLEVTT